MFPNRYNCGEMTPFQYCLLEAITIADLHYDRPLACNELHDDDAQLLHGVQQHKLWDDEVIAKGCTSVNFDELRRYCNNDTCLLYVSVLKFREAFLSQTATEKLSFDKKNLRAQQCDHSKCRDVCLPAQVFES